VSDLFFLLIRSEYLFFSELLRAEYEDANPNVDHEDELDDDNKAERNSRVLAHVELARTVREFNP
jgi:hypothetical protein